MPDFSFNKIFKTDIKEVNNSLLNDEEYNKRKTVLESYPKTVFIQAAGPCNSSCSFCSRGKEYEIFNLDTHRRRFEKNLYPCISKAETLVFTGSGEFLLLPQACEILDFFDTEFPQAEKFFSTNGSPLSVEICDKIAKSKSGYTIHISLHASNAGLHKVMTRTENFHVIIEHIKYLRRIKEKKENLRINLIFVATTLNIDDLPDFVRLAADLKADKAVCYYNYIYAPAQKYLSCFFKQELTNKMIDEAGSLSDKLAIEIDLPPRFNQREYPRLNICREPFSQIMFNAAGQVLPCDASEDCNEVLSGEKDFMDIWNSAYYQRLRRLLIEGNSPCFKHCLRANPATVNDFGSHVIHRGLKEGQDIDILWGDNF